MTKPVVHSLELIYLEKLHDYSLSFSADKIRSLYIIRNSTPNLSQQVMDSNHARLVFDWRNWGLKTIEQAKACYKLPGAGGIIPLVKVAIYMLKIQN